MQRWLAARGGCCCLTVRTNGGGRRISPRFWPCFANYRVHLSSWLYPPPQLRALPRLHSLWLYGMPHAADGYEALTAVISLRSLLLHSCGALPACLPQLTGLETLSILDIDDLMDHSEGEPAATLEAAWPHLTGLTRLELAGPFGPWPIIPATLPHLAGHSRLHSLLLTADIAGTQLPVGLSGLCLLAAPAQLLAASLPALTAASSLQKLVLLSCDSLLGIEDSDQAKLLSDLLAVTVRLPQLGRLVLEASNEHAGAVQDVLLAACSLQAQQGPGVPARFDFLVTPCAPALPEVREMASAV